MDRVQKMIGSLRRDMSFAAFFRTLRSLSTRLREIALGFVEGYHAAHAAPQVPRYARDDNGCTDQPLCVGRPMSLAYNP